MKRGACICVRSYKQLLYAWLLLLLVTMMHLTLM